MMGDYKGVIIADLKPAVGASVDDKNWRSIRDHCQAEAMANAVLIAATKKLLNACKLAQRIIKTEHVITNGMYINELSVIEKAIESATYSGNGEDE